MTRSSFGGARLTVLLLGLVLGSGFVAGIVAEREGLTSWVAARFARRDTPSEGRFLLPRSTGRGKDAVRGLAYLRSHRDRTKPAASTSCEAGAPDCHHLVVSGHGPEALLLDGSGKVVHRWRRTYESVWPGPLDVYSDTVARTYWRRAHMFPNGDLLAMFGGIGLVKLDKDSNVLWSYKGNSHHDLDFDADGNIYTLGREIEERRLNTARKHESPEVIDDFVDVLDANGKRVKRVSILRCFERSDYAPMLEFMFTEVDVLHTNAIRWIDGTVADRIPFFARGHVLLSFRHIHTIAVVDLEAERVVWALAGQWSFQHDPRILANGNVLVFDNGPRNGKSKVIEIDPLTREERWSFRGGEHFDFYSRTCGANYRLPNGNTLIVESDNGRALEVAPDHRVVWRFHNPFRGGDDGELVATLFDLIRIPVSEIRFETTPPKD